MLNILLEQYSFYLLFSHEMYLIQLSNRQYQNEIELYQLVLMTIPLSD